MVLLHAFGFNRCSQGSELTHRQLAAIVVMQIVLLSVNFDAKAQLMDIDTAKQVTAKYGSNGFELQTRDKRFSIQIRSRLQFRFATPEDQNPVTFDDFSAVWCAGQVIKTVIPDPVPVWRHCCIRHQRMQHHIMALLFQRPIEGVHKGEVIG